MMLKIFLFDRQSNWAQLVTSHAWLAASAVVPSCADPHNFSEAGGIGESRAAPGLSSGHAIEERRLKHA